ncbi:hypothetical protein TICRE_04010 [Tissierella creatinophila DSM 6911]|uniref:Uncharacterized protein n=2 Tax=Tissierella creatinophila TaxID=79681 RepID=A0A1U7M883_TISCR|nr:hypothetical protein TICRE_04010 [Tissierella creatinophila DSM 6911]
MIKLLNKLKLILKDKGGSSFPLIIAVTLALIIIFTGISEYFRLMIIAQGVRDAVQDAVISTVNDNYDDVYHGVREGYSGGYQPVADDFQESLNYGDIYGRLDNILGLNQSGGYHIKSTSDNKMEFRIWDLDVVIRNAPIASGDILSSRFKIDSTIMLEVPVSFGGKLLPSMKIRIKTSAGYTPKF